MGRVLTTVILVYKATISRLLPRHCRYEPTCSTYALEAVRRFGALRGGGMALKRIGRCHPWAPGGIDPVPAERTR
ncbi:MAG TPA: membrane protein insertion efficiency factor YidD [Actinomycetota bacterium]|nr:membrane protein insertion efficiency factor YidD [Actinomycetota bacterium]